MCDGRKEKGLICFHTVSAGVVASVFFRMNGTESSAEREWEVGSLNRVEKGRNEVLQQWENKLYREILCRARSG